MAKFSLTIFEKFGIIILVPFKISVDVQIFVNFTIPLQQIYRELHGKAGDNYGY